MLKFDVNLNLDLNERAFFILANAQTPWKAVHSKKSYTRCFSFRDKNTGASDSEHVILYTDDETSFINSYCRFINLSPIL